jgi:mycothiol synthase
VSIQIEPFDQATAPEPLLVQVHELWSLWDAEYLPDDPPIPLAQRLADLRNVRSDRLQPKWGAWSGSDLVGMSGAWIDVARDDDKNAYAGLFVHPEHRGKGYARLLSAPLLDAVEQRGRTRLATETPVGHSGGRLAEAVGLKPAMQAKRSRLSIADVDHDLMRAWIDRASERASQYELLFFESPMPDDIVEEFCRLTLVMNTAPLEDFEEEDRIITPEMWREREENVAKASERVFTYIAAHKPTGEYAGYTNINYQGLHPSQAWQWDTGVDPAHRNNGLGRWLKAQMIETLVESFPEIERIDTYNAGSNAPMLNINIAMGFKPIMIEQVYQGPLDGVRDWLGRSENRV